MDDFESELIRAMREANARRRGYADFFGWPPDRDIEETYVAKTLCEALEAAGQPLASSVVSRGRGNDPPDCEGIREDGCRIAIEVTELVDPDAIVAARRGTGYEWAEWDSPKLCAAVQERLTAKDSCSLKGGPYDTYVVAIHTDEPELDLARLRALLGSNPFKVPNLVDRAFLLLSYDPNSKSYPFIELPLSDT